ncbi:MAG: hypothetical protein PHI96_01735 [Desulfovibrio sp.]|nr:hypothetical protein [Desulfovibrio sp.]
MRALIPAIMALCLCLGASLAQAKSDPGDQQSGLDFFNMGMSQADAKKMGAKAAEKDTMSASFKWEGAQWNALITFKKDEAVLVGMTTKDLRNTLVFAFLNEMEQRTYVPLAIVRNDGTKETEIFLPQEALAGKDASALSDIMTKELNDYASQEKGTIIIMFCGQDNFNTIVAGKKNGKDDDAAMAAVAEDIIYTMQMDKADDVLGIVYASLNTLLAQ